MGVELGMVPTPRRTQTLDSSTGLKNKRYELIFFGPFLLDGG